MAVTCWPTAKPTMAPMQAASAMFQVLFIDETFLNARVPGRVGPGVAQPTGSSGENKQRAGNIVATVRSLDTLPIVRFKTISPAGIPPAFPEVDMKKLLLALAAFAFLATAQAKADDTKPADTKADTKTDAKKPAKKSKKSSKKKADKPADAAATPPAK